MTLDRIDFFFDCAYVLLPQGMHTGCLMCIEHLFLRAKSTNVYLAEQSFNTKKGTKSTKISIVRHALLSKDCIENMPSSFGFQQNNKNVAHETRLHFQTVEVEYVRYNEISCLHS